MAGKDWNGGAVVPAKALDILDRCSNLIFCAMKIESNTWISSSPITATLPSLRSLDIQEAQSIDIGLTEFFDALALPGLQHFSYARQLSNFNGVNYPVPKLPFKSLIMQPHTPGIDSLELRLKYISKDGLVSNCLAHLPSLKRLNLFGATPTWDDPDGLGTGMSDDDLITLLTPSSDSGNYVCPGLEEIRFENAVITDDILCTFLTKRTCSSPEVVRLKHAKFSLLHPQVGDVMNVLTPLIAEGLDVHLDYIINNDPIPGACSPRRGLPNDDMWMV
jgi:hypothetical protein